MRPDGVIVPEPHNANRLSRRMHTPIEGSDLAKLVIVMAAAVTVAWKTFFSHLGSTCASRRVKLNSIVRMLHAFFVRIDPWDTHTPTHRQTTDAFLLLVSLSI